MITEIGVIEKDKNLFSCESWVEQGFEFTAGRRKFLPALLRKDEKTIRLKFSVNDGAYIAFVAIRWVMPNGWMGK